MSCRVTLTFSNHYNNLSSDRSTPSNDLTFIHLFCDGITILSLDSLYLIYFEFLISLIHTLLRRLITIACDVLGWYFCFFNLFYQFLTSELSPNGVFYNISFLFVLLELYVSVQSLSPLLCDDGVTSPEVL